KCATLFHTYLPDQARQHCQIRHPELTGRRYPAGIPLKPAHHQKNQAGKKILGRLIFITSKVLNLL
ncbi:MAG: hypothetical protein K2K95_08145, partial [Muribaculaceae bacterium]|nr:hypothetical protein [Muribaculaceae bacterium]